MAKKRNTLGRGLEALLGAVPAGVQELKSTPMPAISSMSSFAPDLSTEKGEWQELELKKLSPGRYQPRHQIREENLEPLVDSIKAQGIIQPIVVRQKSKDQYEIIAGERRWRAANLAGLKTVPVVVKDVSDEKAMAIALIENIQRENLNALEEAEALERLTKEFNLTHNQVAEAVGKSRTAITNLLRLLTLTEEVKELLEKDNLEVGHAKVLLSLKGEEQKRAAQRIISQSLSVRETERLVAQMLDTVSVKSKSKRKTKDPDIQRLQNSLSEQLGASVEVVYGNHGKGKLIIHYNSLEELEGILEHIQ